MKNTNVKGSIAIFSVFFASFSLTLGLSFFAFKSLAPQKVKASSLTNASALLSNPRLSYMARVKTGTSGSSSIEIEGTGAYPDTDTNNLFPKDSICFTNAYPAGCIGNVSYSVATISGGINGTTFSLSTPLTTSADTSGYAIASQTGNLTLTFTLVSTIPSGGNISIAIPVADAGNVNNGFPDTGATPPTSGFDFNRLEPTRVNVSSTGGTCTGGWNTPVVASASGTITITKATNSCAGATVTVVIPDLVNPAPTTDARTQGVAEPYKISILTKDGSGGILDLTNVIAAPVEGVLVSATIDQSLSFTVAGVASSQSVCGKTTNVTTQAFAIPWGTIVDTAFRVAAQNLKVSTNASGGYSVKISESDQMGLNGVACNGAEDETVDCIRDTACGASACTHITSADWTSNTSYPGLGYSLENVTGKGTDAAFLYNESSRTFSAKQLPDASASEAIQTVMSNATPVSDSQIDVCYQIAVTGTQPAGYYYNKVLYTATATF